MYVLSSSVLSFKALHKQVLIELISCALNFFNFSTRDKVIHNIFFIILLSIRRTVKINFRPIKIEVAGAF